MRRRAWVRALGALGTAAALGVLPAASRAAPETSADGSGEVRRVDAAQGTVAIRQGEIKALNLPAMTLVYHADPALLRDIKPGDKVSFTASRQADGRYVLTAIGRTLLPIGQ